MKTLSLSQTLNFVRAVTLKQTPAYVQFYITARCDLECEQCNIIYSDARYAECDIPTISKIADNLASIGMASVLLIGGEPFVRKDLPEIVKAFTEKGIHVRMQTNGLASRRTLEACVQNGGHDISISLDTLQPNLQDTINGGRANTWARAIKAVALVNEVFPENGMAFFGSVLMPRNIDDLPGVLEFAAKIGWGMSLVPVHTTVPSFPRSFRSYDPTGVLNFSRDDMRRVEEMIATLRAMKRNGYTLYDSDEYLDDIVRHVKGLPVMWRRRNCGVCDSPDLYFAIAPDGRIRPCVDYDLGEDIAVYDKDFPKWFADGLIRTKVQRITCHCSGCMYGSYPEMTISARYYRALFERAAFFAHPPRLQHYSDAEMTEIAQEIYRKQLEGRRS